MYLIHLFYVDKYTIFYKMFNNCFNLYFRASADQMKTTASTLEP